MAKVAKGLVYRAYSRGLYKGFCGFYKGGFSV